MARLPVGSGTVFFPDVGQKLPGVFFQYREGWKARAYPEKAFVANGGLKLSFWNFDAVLQGDMARVFIADGELDVCALVEAGVPPQYGLSVPNGAKERPADDPKEQRGYEYVQEALRAGLSRARKFIWCGDAGQPGTRSTGRYGAVVGRCSLSFR